MVALSQSLLRQTVPQFRAINAISGFKSNIQITTFDGEIESGVLVLDEVKGDLQHIK